MATEIERASTAPPVTVDIDTLRYLGYDPENVATRALVLLAHRYQLDPLLGEIILISDNKGRRLYVTRDGMIAVAHASGQLNGIEVIEQRRNTEGNGWTAYVSVWRKDMEHPFTYGAQCKDSEAQARAGNGPEMALARAERRALKRAFRIRSDFYPENPHIEDIDADEIESPTGEAAPREVSITRPPAAPSVDSQFIVPTPEQIRQMRDLRAELGLAERESRPMWLALLGRAVGHEVLNAGDLDRNEIATCIEFLTGELIEHAQAIADARRAAEEYEASDAEFEQYDNERAEETGEAEDGDGI